MGKTYSSGTLWVGNRPIGSWTVEGGWKYCYITIDLAPWAYVTEEGAEEMRRLYMDYLKKNIEAIKIPKWWWGCGGGIQFFLVLVKDWREMMSKLLDIIKRQAIVVSTGERPLEKLEIITN